MPKKRKSRGRSDWSARPSQTPLLRSQQAARVYFAVPRLPAAQRKRLAEAPLVRGVPMATPVRLAQLANLSGPVRLTVPKLRTLRNDKARDRIFEQARAADVKMARQSPARRSLNMRTRDDLLREWRERVCADRKARRKAILSQGRRVAGKGSASPRQRTPESQVKC